MPIGWHKWRGSMWWFIWWIPDDLLENSNTEQSGESTKDEIHNDIQQIL